MLTILVRLIFKMELISKEGGYALFKLSDELHFVDYKTSGLYTSIFVFGLITVITLLNVAIQVFLGKGLAISALLIPGLICLFLWRKQKIKRRIREGAPSKENTVLILDTAKGEFLTADRESLGKLDTCRFEYSFQATSSSKKLIFHYPNGEIVIAKGNPFGGSNKPFRNALQKFNLSQ